MIRTCAECRSLKIEGHTQYRCTNPNGIATNLSLEWCCDLWESRNEQEEGEKVLQILMQRSGYIPPQADGGVKHDGGKVPLELIPPEMIFALGRALGFGVLKHGRRNWENDANTERLLGSLLRHLFAWHGGEKLDPESDLSHLDHAAARLAMLIAAVERSEK